MVGPDVRFRAPAACRSAKIPTDRVEGHAVLEAMADPVIFCDRDRRIVLTNPAFESVFGYRHDEVVGHSTRILYADPDQFDALGHQRYRDWATPQPRPYPMLYRRKDGSTIWLETVDAAVRDREGRLLGFVGIHRDLTERRRIEQELADAAELRRLAFEAERLGAWSFDVQRDVVFWDERCREIFGRDLPEPIATSTILNLIVPEDHAQVVQAMRQALDRSSGGWFETRFRVALPDGSIRWVASHGQGIWSTGWCGQLVRFVGTVQDVTERVESERALRESEERSRRQLAQLTSIYKTAPVGLCFFDRELRFLGVNQRMAELNGRSIEEHIGRTIDEFSPRLGELIAPLCRRVIETGEPIEHIEFHEPQPNPPRAKRHWLASYHPVTDEQGEVLGVNAVVQDVTDLKQAEQAVRELNAALEQRVWQRTGQVRRQAEQLRLLAIELTQAEQRERRRVARTLHDHLQQILAAAKMRLDIVGSRIDPQARALTEPVAQLIGEAISASRTLAVELSPPVLYDRGLPAALEWAARQFQDKHHLTVHVEAQPDADPARDELRAFLFDAVRELLFNVVKHARTDRAWVRLRRNADAIVLDVEDQGVGCDEAILAASFTRSDSFGLFNIRQRLDLLGGTFTLDTRPGGGCRVSMSVPPEQSPGQRAATRTERGDGNQPLPNPGQQPVARQSIRVLLVDDHRILREGLAGLLQEQPDLDVVGEAEDGVEAIQLTRQLHPDVIVMDVSMPRLGGVEATRRIKADFPQVRVIGLSMHEKDDLARAMIDAGAAAYLTKGGPSDALVAAIRA